MIYCEGFKWILILLLLSFDLVKSQYIRYFTITIQNYFIPMIKQSYYYNNDLADLELLPSLKVRLFTTITTSFLNG